MDIWRAESRTLELEDGSTVGIDTSFRRLATASAIALDPYLSDAEKEEAICRAITGKEIANPERIVAAYVARYFPASRAGGIKALDFAQDAEAIYAGFRQAYGIDLHDAPTLTAGEFLALLRNIPDHTRIAQTMEIRTAPMPKDKEAGERLARAKRRVALKPSDGSEDSGGFSSFARAVETMAKTK